MVFSRVPPLFARLLLLFVAVLFGVLLNFPLLAAFDHGERVAGVPVLYWYILLTWALLISLTGWLVSKTS